MRFGPMLCVHLLGLCLVTGFLHSPAASQTTAAPSEAEQIYDLQSVRRESEITRVEALLEVEGKLKLKAGDTIQSYPVSVAGKIAYDEKLLEGKPSELDWLRSLRQYQQTDAAISIEKGQVTPQLRADRHLIGVVVRDGRPLLYSPDGPLSREELDLIELPGNSLLIEGLLPEEPVRLNESWKHSDNLLAALLNIEAIGANEVESRLVEVTDDTARIETAGHVNGAIHGVATEIELKAKIKVDLSLRRITWFAMALKEQRSIGHVDPGVEVVARLQMKLTPDVDSPRLDPAALKLTRQQFQNADARLSYESPTGRYGLLYDRRWFVINDEPELTVLRYVDRGELLAQCNISVRPEGEIPPLAKFQQDIKQSLGDSFGQFVRASQTVNDQGLAVYRVVASGMASDLPIQWNYYLVSDPEGNSVVLLFTLEEHLVERFGAADEELVSNVRILARTIDETAQPTPAAARR